MFESRAFRRQSLVANERWALAVVAEGVMYNAKFGGLRCSFWRGMWAYVDAATDGYGVLGAMSLRCDGEPSYILTGYH